MWEIRCQRVLCCNGRQPPHACGVLTHLQAGGLGQAGRAGQMPDGCWPPPAGTTPGALAASARAASFGACWQYVMRIQGWPQAKAVQPAGTAQLARAKCMCKSHGRLEMPFTFMLCLRWALLCRRLSVQSVALQIEGPKSDVRTDLQIDGIFKP